MSDGCRAAGWLYGIINGRMTLMVLWCFYLRKARHAASMISRSDKNYFFLIK